MNVCPLSSQQLSHYLALHRDRAPRGPAGVHQRRRHGQSLDFREHRQYTPGDDFRNIDWRASVRRGRAPRQLEDLLVRRFEAEEQLTLVLSLDNRQTMRATAEESLSKWQIACWLAAAMASIGLKGRDRVHLHRLFGPRPRRAASRRGVGSETQAFHQIRTWSETLVNAQATPEIHSLIGLLPPAAVWVIVTDLYFDDRDGLLVKAIRDTLRGPRGVVVIELDNWPHERARLEGDACRIEGPGRERSVEVRVDGPLADRVEHRIREHKRAWLERVAHPGLEATTWQWRPEARLTEPAFADFFTRQFLKDELISNLFRRRR